MASVTSDEFTCERPDIFVKLQDVEWFMRFIAYQTSDILREGDTGDILRDSGFLFELSGPLLGEAFNSYHRDLTELGEIDPEWRGLVHSLYSAHLCYWLRQCSPITAMHERPHRGDPAYREFLKAYGNEFVAFEVGFRICRFFEARRADLYAMLDALARLRGGSITEVSVSTTFLRAVCRILKEQSVSAPALVLIYRALFLDIRVRGGA